jgi:hypothetical protein
MIDASAVKLIVQTLSSQNVYARNSAVDALCRMAEHGANNIPCMIVVLTNVIQGPYRLP